MDYCNIDLLTNPHMKWSSHNIMLQLIMFSAGGVHDTEVKFKVSLHQSLYMFESCNLFQIIIK